MPRKMIIIFVLESNGFIEGQFAYDFSFCYQMGAAETTFEEVQNIFDTGSAKGLAGDLVEKIPKIIITNNNNVDASGEKVSCSVCLQVQPYCIFYFTPISVKLVA